ncbi:Phosphatidylserine decarboxylase proenzyme [compost metagenome]
MWHGVVNPPRHNSVQEWTYADQDIVLKKGDELGRFLLGSTVVMLFPKDTLHFNESWQPAGPVRLGETMANLK